MSRRSGSAVSTPLPERLFGTDGIRAPFGEPPLERRTVTALGARLAEMLGERAQAPLVVMGGDTRASTPEICGWLAAGLSGAGGRVRQAGVLPTAGVSFLVRDLDADAGVVVSASHNPAADNGIKFFTRDGFKFSPAAEARLEEGLRRRPPDEPTGPVAPAAVEPELGERYLEALEALLPEERPLDGLRLALDVANGAAAPFAARLFRDLGAEVLSLHDDPDGSNINLDCGSTHVDVVSRAVAEAGLDLGIAFDGDADRALLADESGTPRDGDAMLYLWAADLMRRGRLDPPRIVATSMSNLGLERALAAEGIEVLRCAVGDRAVVETMRAEGIVLGGEQSGHLVHLRRSATGDGLVTALECAACVKRGGRPLSELLASFRRYPQVLRSVRVTAKPELSGLPRVAAAAAAVERCLGDSGRLVLRYSGTEPLARVMIEGPEQAEIEDLAEELLRAIRLEIGLDGGA